MTNYSEIFKKVFNDIGQRSAYSQMLIIYFSRQLSDLQDNSENESETVNPDVQHG